MPGTRDVLPETRLPKGRHVDRLEAVKVLHDYRLVSVVTRVIHSTIRCAMDISRRSGGIGLGGSSMMVAQLPGI